MDKLLTGDTYKLNSLFVDILTKAMSAYGDMRIYADNQAKHDISRAKLDLCVDLLKVDYMAFAAFCDAYADAVKAFEETDKSDFFDHFMGAPRATEFYKTYFGFVDEMEVDN